MRNFIVWTLSLLLGFEPALFAQGRADRMANMKAGIEQSHIAQRPVKIKELFQKIMTDLPQAERDQFQKFVQAFGDQQLPKLDVTKTKGPNGSEYYRLQGVKNGQAITVELIDDGTTFARVNGKNLTYQDLSSVQKALAIVGVPSEAINEYFPRKPANFSDFLNFEQFQQLKVEDRNKYINQIRQLMESMEAVEHSSQNQKKSSLENRQHFDFVSWFLQGESAWAAVGDCIAAGQIIPGGAKAGGSCGMDSKGNVPQKYRTADGVVLCSNPKEILCHPFVYSPKNVLCVKAGPNSTQLCNAGVKDRETFDLAMKGPKVQENFRNMKTHVQNHANQVWAICQENPDAMSEDQTIFKDEISVSKQTKPKPPKKGSKGAKTQKKKKPSDMKGHCDRFKDRLDEINGWCQNADYIKAYPALCSDQDQPIPVAPAPTQPVTPNPSAPETCPAGHVCCDNLPVDMSRDKGSCDESGGNLGTGICYNTQTKTSETNIFVCACTNGFDGKMKCAKQKEETESKTKDKKPKKDKGETNWWIVGGVVGLLGFLGYKAYQGAMKQWYQNIEPQPQNPPIPPPVTPTPTPGSPPVQPPPPRGAV